MVLGPNILGLRDDIIREMRQLISTVGGLASVSADPSPALGGDLDLDGHAIPGVTDAVARVDPGSAGSAGQDYRRSPVTNAPMWTKRRYIIVDDVLADGGTIQDALNLVPSSGADVVFRADGSSYTVPNAGLTVKAKTRIVPMGSRAAVLTAPSGASGDTVLSLTPWGAAGVTIEGVEVDCDDHATMQHGIRSFGNSPDYRDTRLIDVVVRNALGYGIHTWQTNGLTVERAQIYDCSYGIYANQARGIVRLVNPVIINATAGRMLYGIRADFGDATSDIEIAGAHISGADYATSTGAEAHGISISACPRYRIIGGIVTECGNPANNAGGGLVIAEAHEGSVSDFSASDNHGVGIWSELEPGGDTSLGTAGQVRGAQLTNIHVNRNASAGLSASYGAGTVIDNIEAAANGGEGIVWDCDGLILTNFRVYNNWQDSGASAPAQNDGAKAGIRSYNGKRSIIANGHCYDNQAAKTQVYGVAVHEHGHILTSIVTRDADHVTGGLIESTGSGANTKTAVVT